MPQHAVYLATFNQVRSSIARRLGLQISGLIPNALFLENDWQKKVFNKFLDGIEGKLTTSKWAKMN